MELPEMMVDGLRALHLLCFAAGMGIAIFFDWRSLSSLHVPIDTGDFEVLHEIHAWITIAFIGLWLTGVTLVFVRTGFDLQNFTPKLYTKLAVMTVMVVNARAISRYVLPVFAANIGQSLLRLPYRKLVGITQCAINSIFCWVSGLILGSSVVLKTAGWDLLVPLFVGGGFAITLLGQSVIIVLLIKSRLSVASQLKAARVGP